jgi:hypothetical protein
VLSETPYNSEDIFQEVLATFPEVLAGGTTTDDGEVRKLLLVSREMGVPSDEGGSARWSLDHLFIDERAVPVFVEVKRSSDTRIRREVVGQMLDYAANGISYWPIEDLQRGLTASSGMSPEEALRACFGAGFETDKFWTTVEQNLKEGNVRLVFVADHLPPELVRIIEFLNERMTPTEVLGVEVVQFLGEGQQVFVPELVGKTARAVKAKGQPGRQWDEASFLDTVSERYGQPTEALFRTMFDHVRERGRFSWGRGVSPGVTAYYPVGGQQVPIWNSNAGVYGRSDDGPYLYTYPSEIRAHVEPERFERFVAQLYEVDAYKQKLDEARSVGWTGKYPTCLLAGVVHSEADRQRLLAAFDAVADAPVGEPRA